MVFLKFNWRYHLLLIFLLRKPLRSGGMTAKPQGVLTSGQGKTTNVGASEPNSTDDQETSTDDTQSLSLDDWDSCFEYHSYTDLFSLKHKC